MGGLLWISSPPFVKTLEKYRWNARSMRGTIGSEIEFSSHNCKNDMQLNITNFTKRRKDKLVENVYDSFIIEI